jgi:hypothetical protein
LRTRLLVPIVATVVAFAFAVAAQAQYGSTPSYGSSYGYGFGQSSGSAFGQSSMFGSRSMGTGVTAGQRTFTGSSLGSQQGFGASSSYGANRQAGDFVGIDTENTRRFVGASQTGSRAGGSTSRGGLLQQTGSGGGFGQQSRGQSQNGGRGNQPGQTADQDRGAIRCTLRVAFDYAPPTPAALSASLTQRLADIPAIHARSPLRVEVQGRTAVLRGAVATEHDRALAEQMIRLEAGIEAVKNEIVAGDSTPAKPAAPR